MSNNSTKSTNLEDTEYVYTVWLVNDRDDVLVNKTGMKKNYLKVPDVTLSAKSYDSLINKMEKSWNILPNDNSLVLMDEFVHTKVRKVKVFMLRLDELSEYELFFQENVDGVFMSKMELKQKLEHSDITNELQGIARVLKNKILV